MRGNNPNLYWVICYLVVTPVVTIVALILALAANAEVKLNDYIYPTWAHAVNQTIKYLFICL